MEKERKGDWIQTYTGKSFYPLDPRENEIDIKDIAHALSLTCRFGGHCDQFYSVAHHSLWCLSTYIDMCASGTTRVNIRSGSINSNIREFLTSHMIFYDRKLARTILMHDAAEAYISDLPRPLKKNISGYIVYETEIEKVIADKFDLYYPFPSIVKSIDTAMLLNEKAALMVENIPWVKYDLDVNVTISSGTLIHKSPDYKLIESLFLDAVNFLEDRI